MNLGDTERNRAAVHEAGHALVAASRGLGVAVIELYDDDGAGGMRLRDEPPALDRVWILYGGPFAEKVVFGKLTTAPVSPDLDELLQAHRLCGQLGISATIGIMDQVAAYLREHQVRLELLATRLLETYRLSGAELDELLGQEPSPASPPSAISPSWHTILGRTADFARLWRGTR
jgi:ATP-dependent Zn protease